MFWFWIIIAVIVGCAIGVVTMSMMFVAKDADRQINSNGMSSARRLTGRNIHHGYITTTSSKGGIGVYDAVVEKLFEYEETGLSPSEVAIALAKAKGPRGL